MTISRDCSVLRVQIFYFFAIDQEILISKFALMPWFITVGSLPKSVDGDYPTSVGCTELLQ